MKQEEEVKQEEEEEKQEEVKQEEEEEEEEASSLTVSSVQMEWTCVPNMTEVKRRKRRPSKQRRMRKMTVAGGEKLLHSKRGTSHRVSRVSHVVLGDFL